MPPGNKKYVILNGHFYDADKPLIGVNNRAFKFGDALFETIRCHKTVPLFFEDHYNRLIRGMAILHYSIATLPPITSFLRDIERLIVRNRIFEDARVRLTVFRREGGLYTPQDNSIAYLLEATTLESKGYALNQNGFRIGLYTEFSKTWTPLSPFKTLATAPSILAGICKNSNHWDDCLIINDRGMIIEGISSNLFWIRENTLYTPSITSGCVDGIMRHQIFRYCAINNIKIQETQGALQKELLEAEELFLTNAINGIHWVVAYEDKRYYNRLPKKITQWLNNQLNPDY